MQKIQILFPDSLVEKMLSVANASNISVSEMVQRATEKWLSSFPDLPIEKQQVPTISAGKCLINPENFRNATYE
ncbi:MAG: hypothetical protein L3J39_00760 [Verrucomicrobiales bacterium]|nr:hypothetical protein [Verrucomicrobiales bacterium]